MPSEGAPERVCQPSPSPSRRASSSMPKSSLQKRRARSGSSAGNSTSESCDWPIEDTITDCLTRFPDIFGFMPKRQRRRPRSPEVTTSDYHDREGNVLTVRDSVSKATIAKLQEPPATPGASADDLWRRRAELMFERF